MFVLIFILTLCYAHNWIHGVSRVPKLSMQVPAPPRAGPRQPHRQVGAGQDFVIEFMTGHPGSYYYFVVVKATDEDKLSENTKANLDAYISQAPDDAYIYNDPKYDRTHISCTHNHQSSPAGRGDCGQSSWNSGSRYERLLTESDPMWIDRTPWHANPGSNMAHFKYSENDLKFDKRVSYDNENFPWIEAIHKFRVNYRYPKEWDAARLSLPGRQGPGEYMVHMVWGGYRDVLDIDVLPAPANDIYGRQKTTKEFVKSEHCQYTNYTPRNTRCHFLQSGESAETCLDRCRGMGNRCTGVNVVPVFNPASVKIAGHEPSDANVPWQNQGGSKFCKQQWVPDDADENTMICYGFLPRDPEDPAFNPEAETQYYIRDSDPEDPIYYSTCYHQVRGREFIDNPPCPACEGNPVLSPAQWQIGDECLSCEDLQKHSNSDSLIVERWKTSGVCEKCF